jgi:hypothetical protein
MPPTRAVLLQSPIQDLLGLWLRVECTRPCTHLTYYPFKLMMRRRPAVTCMLLEHVLPKLKCEACGRRPARARVVDSPIEDASGTVANAATWSVDVLP